MNARRTFATAVAVTAPVAVAAGAGLEWLLDPDRGKSRRRKLADQAAAAVRRQSRRRVRRLSMRARYERGRLRGGLVRARGGGIPEPTDDVDVKQQVHQALRAAGIPLHAVSVEVSDRTAVLRGQVDTHGQIDRIRAVTCAVPGVFDVEDFLHLPGEPPPNKVASLRATAARN